MYIFYLKKTYTTYRILSGIASFCTYTLLHVSVNACAEMQLSIFLVSPSLITSTHFIQE
jgi:hypothetical protein